MKTAMQELIEDINIEKKMGYITENSANKILDYINNLYLEKEKEQIIDAYYGNIDGVFGYREEGQEYYNQTYNQNK
jgi:hypothetical protein